MPLKKTSQTLFDDFEWKGYWWLPKTPENQVSGNLTFNAKTGVSLELLGSLEGAKSLTDLIRTKIILGTTVEGKDCTLLDGWQTQATMNMPGIVTNRFEVAYLFAGHHFPSEPDIQFPDLSMSLTNLEEWAERFPFNVEFSKPQDDRTFQRTASYVTPDDFKTYVPSINATVLLENHFSETGDRRREFNWQHQDFLKLVPAEPKSFVWFWRHLFDLKLFLTLCIGEPVHPKRVYATGPEIEVRPGQTQTRPVEVFFGDRWAQQRPEPIQPYQMLVTLPAISQSLSKILDNWFRRVDALRPVLELFFGTLFASDMYLNLHFLNFVRALEVYHRRTRDGLYMAEDEYRNQVYEALSAAIPSDLPPGLREALKSRLKFGNEHSLSKRLTDLMDSLPSELRGLVSNDPAVFIRNVVDTRNYLTHFTQELQDRQFRDVELVNANRNLRLLLTILMFRELGFEDGVIRKIVEGKKQFKQVPTQN